MPESLSPALLALRDKAEQFAADVLVPAAQALQTQDSHRDEILETVRSGSLARGLFRMTQPRSHGGLESDLLELTVVRETLAHHNTGLLGRVFGPGPGLLGGCPEPLRSSHLVPVLDGRKRAGFALTEPSDAPHFTKATRTSEGAYVVRGRKSYVTGGRDADFLVTVVEIPDRGRSLLVIDRDAPGVIVEQVFESMDGSHHAAFQFDAVHVPESHLIGAPGEGLPRAMRQIGDTRLIIAADAVGLARWALAFVTTHLKAPHHSGEPLGAREGVRLRYADLRIRTFAARSMLYRVARMAVSGANTVNEVIACKVFATETLAEVADGAIQLVGGQALVVGHPLERLYREARSLRLAEGASDVLRLNLARGHLDLDKGVL
jgi:alkylation response protein AidB-like acyl-CoA dehydrogenase